MSFRTDRNAALCEAKAIARSELARRRRQLGELTCEQEIGVENLIMSTVTKVLEVAGTALDSFALDHEGVEPLASPQLVMAVHTTT